MENNETTIEILNLYKEFIDKSFSIIHKWDTYIERLKVNKDTERLKNIMQIMMNEYQEQQNKLN